MCERFEYLYNEMKKIEQRQWNFLLSLFLSQFALLILGESEKSRLRVDFSGDISTLLWK
jgi:hypothetical protein